LTSSPAAAGRSSRALAALRGWPLNNVGVIFPVARASIRGVGDQTATTVYRGQRVPGWMAWFQDEAQDHSRPSHDERHARKRANTVVAG
jgi:hypothetical protein